MDSENRSLLTGYRAYVDEIEELRKKYGLGITEVFLLQISASFEAEGLTYEKLKEAYCK